MHPCLIEVTRNTVIALYLPQSLLYFPLIFRVADHSAEKRGDAIGQSQVIGSSRRLEGKTS